MKDLMKKFLNILKVELDDLIDDIIIIEESYNQKKQQNEITDYVLRENNSVLKSEQNGVRAVLKLIGEIDVSKYNNLNDLSTHCQTFFNKKIKECGYPPAVFLLINRRISKVLEYTGKITITE